MAASSRFATVGEDDFALKCFFFPFFEIITCVFILKQLFASGSVIIGEYSGSPNDQFVVKCIIIPQLMKINVIKAFSGVFQCCWENIICSFFPARHTRNFPAS